jgi:diacylglycerol kinase|tara:strand:- start:827 stop:1024 length:198 start_codon:yes stop_codon:yes gene_type:complete
MDNTKSGLWDVFKSVAASVFGVQSSANRERDFQQKSFVPYVVVGVIFVVALVISLVLVVSVVVPS